MPIIFSVAGTVPGSQPMDVDHDAGNAHQDRCQDRAACEVHVAPVGRSGDPAKSVRDDPSQDRPASAEARNRLR